MLVLGWKGKVISDRFLNYQKSDKRPSKVYEFHIALTDLKF